MIPHFLKTRMSATKISIAMVEHRKNMGTVSPDNQSAVALHRSWWASVPVVVGVDNQNR